MFTLQDLLNNHIFSTAKVVAGEGGLSHVVKWSHIVDLPDVVSVAGEGPQLILTTGQAIPADAVTQKKFIVEMARAGLSGIIVSVGGSFLQEIPQPMIDAANQWDFPIITVPSEVRFIEITRIIHEQLVSQQYALLKRSDHIHQTLVQIVLEGGGLQDLAKALAQLVNRSVTIEDPELNVLASAEFGEVDPARQQSIKRGGTPEFIREFVREQGILDRLNQSLKPTKVRAFPEHGMTKERIVAPIVVERKVYGYLWLIATDEPLDESDTMTIERAAIVAALIMLKEDAIRQTEARLQADVISQLLSDEPHSLALADKANRLGLDLQQAQRVMLLHLPVNTLPSLRMADKLRPLVRQYTTRAILQPLGGNFILILPDEVDEERLAASLISTFDGLKIGIGNIAPTLMDLAESYQQAKEALEVGEALSSTESIFRFADLGFLHWLYLLPTKAGNGNRYADQVRLLATEERAERAQLLRTLEVFLDYGGNAAETARELKIHRNTLAYRIKQIETLCSVSLNDPQVRVNLQIAIKAYRLMQRQPEKEA